MIKDANYKAGYSDGYNAGLEDAWEAVRKITSELSLRQVFEIYSASEVVSKLKEYEDKQKQNDTRRCATCRLINECNSTLEDSCLPCLHRYWEPKKQLELYENALSKACEALEQTVTKEEKLDQDNISEWVQVPAKFIDGEKVSNAYYKCSNCESIPLCGVRTNYCAKCGRKMR